MDNDELYEKALGAIQELFGDTSVSQSQAKDNLNSLIGEIQIMMEALVEEDWGHGRQGNGD